MYHTSVGIVNDSCAIFLLRRPKFPNGDRVLITCAHCTGILSDGIPQRSLSAVFERKTRGEAKKTRVWLVALSVTGDYAVYRGKPHAFRDNEGLFLSKDVATDSPPGTQVYTLGYPFGYDMNSISPCLVREIGASLPAYLFGSVDAPPNVLLAGPIAGGNSGGPVLTSEGKVIAIVSSGWSMNNEGSYNAGPQADVIRKGVIQTVADFDPTNFTPYLIQEAYLPCLFSFSSPTIVSGTREGVEVTSDSASGELQTGDLVTKVDWFPTGLVRPSRPPQVYTCRRNIGDTVAVTFFRPDLGSPVSGEAFYQDDFSSYPVGTSHTSWEPPTNTMLDNPWRPGQNALLFTGPAMAYPMDINPITESQSSYIGTFSMELSPDTLVDGGNCIMYFFGSTGTPSVNLGIGLNTEGTTATISFTSDPDVPFLDFQYPIPGDRYLEFAYERTRITGTLSSFSCTLRLKETDSHGTLDSITTDTGEVTYGDAVDVSFTIAENTSFYIGSYEFTYTYRSSTTSEVPQSASVQLTGGNVSQLYTLGFSKKFLLRMSKHNRKRYKVLRNLQEWFGT